MRRAVAFSLCLCFAMAALGTMTTSVQADAYPEGLNSKTRTAPEGKMQAWWDRRSPLEQKIIRALPAEERYIASVCIFLYDPDLAACTNRGVARKRASKYCSDQGHELLTEEMAACEKAFEASFKPIF